MASNILLAMHFIHRGERCINAKTNTLKNVTYDFFWRVIMHIGRKKCSEKS